ncbi:MAG: molybdopterin molybdotransferase MoeA [Candidatus Limnocylindrales bacterium]
MTTAIARSRPSAQLLTLDDARTRMLEGLEALRSETVPIDEALDRVLAAPIESRITLPPWDNSAMDGFAVRSVDVRGATRAHPVRLTVIGESAAGRSSAVEVTEGTAIRILTCAPMPDGADAVVPVEDTDAPMGAAALPDFVQIEASRPPGAHVRRVGSDLREGYPLLAAGTNLSPAALAVAAAGGHAELTVHRAPRIAILATGDELAPVGAALAADQIPDSNSVGLAAQARESGAEVRLLGIASDSLADIVGRLRVGLAWADVIVVSGGVSVGAHDVVKDAFDSVGQVDLWRIAVQPGKPLAFGRARAEAREGEVLMFGLPGNPVSSFVTFELFVRPVLRRLMGHSDLIGRDSVRATLTEPVTKSPGRRAFLRVRLERKPHGAWVASLAGGQDSHVLSALAAANGLAIISEDDDSLPVGAQVEVIRLS